MSASTKTTPAIKRASAKAQVPPKPSPFVQIAVTSDPDAEDYAVYALDAGGRVWRYNGPSLRTMQAARWIALSDARDAASEKTPR